jgi:predicted nucleotidyltransferase
MAVLRQKIVLDGIVDRISGVDAIDGAILLGSFAAGQPDALSDLDLIVVAAPGRLDEAWDARYVIAGDVFVTWEPRPNEGHDIRWLNGLTHDLVKVECGIAAPGSRELAEPFSVVAGQPSVADRFTRIDLSVIEARARQRDNEQQVFDPDEMTPEERLGWKLSEMKLAARAVLRRDADGD